MLTENDASVDSFFRIFTNPTTGLVKLEFAWPENGSMIEIFNIMSKRILTQKVAGPTRIRLGLCAQPEGMYLVKVLNGDGFGVQRIIKQ